MLSDIENRSGERTVQEQMSQKKGNFEKESRSHVKQKCANLQINRVGSLTGAIGQNPFVLLICMNDTNPGNQLQNKDKNPHPNNNKQTNTNLNISTLYRKKTRRKTVKMHAPEVHYMVLEITTVTKKTSLLSIYTTIL